jgi:predicted O-methyltransferase YrrM
MAQRYQALSRIARLVSPHTFIEVGVHTGLRGAEVIRTVLQTRGDMHYIGYDVFETEDEEFHVKAHNGKGIPTKVQAMRNLSEAMRGRGQVTLHVGRTQTTLHGKRAPCDMAFVDGDHRVAAIEADLEAVISRDNVVVLDDFYTNGVGLGDQLRVSTQEYGCNRVVENYGRGHALLLPGRDPIKGGGYTSMVVVSNDPEWIARIDREVYA